MEQPMSVQKCKMASVTSTNWCFSELFLDPSKGPTKQRSFPLTNKEPEEPRGGVNWSQVTQPVPDGFRSQARSLPPEGDLLPRVLLLTWGGDRVLICSFAPQEGQ